MSNFFKAPFLSCLLVVCLLENKEILAGENDDATLVANKAIAAISSFDELDPNLEYCFLVSGKAGKGPSFSGVVFFLREHGIVWTQQVFEKGKDLSVALSNPKYTASVSGNSPGRAQKPLLRFDRDDISFLMDGFYPADKGWISRVASGTLFLAIQGYALSLKSVEEEQLAGRAKLDFTPSSNGSAHRLRFSEFEREIDGHAGLTKLGFLIDPVTFQIREIEGEMPNLKFTFQIESYSTIGSLSFPDRFQLINLQVPSNLRTVTSREWKIVKKDTIGFDDSQLFLTYYGLAEPSPGEIQVPSNRNAWIALFCTLLFGTLGVFYWWRK